MIKYISAKEIFMNYISSYCAKDTISYYDINMRLFENYLVSVYSSLDIDINNLTKADYVGYISYLRNKNIKNTSVRTYSRAIKVFLRYMFFEGYVDNNITCHVKYPKADNSIVIPLNNARVNNIINGMKKSSMYTRNIVIFSLMLDCGLRCGEVVNLKTSDIDFDNDFIRIVNTKNNKSRIVPLPAKVKYVISKYMAVRNNSSSTLIMDCRCQNPITENAIKLMFSKLKAYDSDIHAHLLRHTFATSYIMGGGSLEILRVLMGHEDYAVTKNYIHIATQMGMLNYDIYRLDGAMFNSYKSYKP